MSNIRYVPFWEDDFEADTLGMKPEHKWIYWKICVAITRSDTGWILDDDNWISARVNISPARWRRSRGAIEHHLETKTDKADTKWLSQKRARREHGVATVKLRGNQKGGLTKAKNNPTKSKRGKGKPNKNNGTPHSQPPSQQDGQPYGQQPGQPYGQPPSNRTEQNVISIKEITSARANPGLDEWVMKTTGLDQKTMPMSTGTIKSWERLYHVDDIRQAIETVTRQSSYDWKKVKGLSYFTEAISDLDQIRKTDTAGKIDAALRGLAPDDFKFMIERWFDEDHWPCSVYGPAPDDENNLIPAEILEEFADRIAAREQPKKSAAGGGDEGVDFDSE